MFLQHITNRTIPHKLNERGIKWTICILRLKTKKLAGLITFAESVYHQARSGWISLMRSIVYHHYGVLTHAKSVMICKKERNKSLFLMICTQASCVMIYHYSVMDKKKTAILYQYCSLFLWKGYEKDTKI